MPFWKRKISSSEIKDGKGALDVLADLEADGEQADDDDTELEIDEALTAIGRFGVGQEEEEPENNGSIEPDFREWNAPVPSTEKNSLVGGCMTTIGRNAKFMSLFLPVLNTYRNVVKEARKIRKKYKKKDIDDYYERKNAAIDRAHDKAAPQIKNLIEKLRGLFNKLGQYLAVNAMIMPPELVKQLASTFEELPPRKWSVMQKCMYLSLGNGKLKIGEEVFRAHFESVNEKPLSCASIGQVHTGVLKDGTKVVIKLLYPEIRKYMIIDLANMKQAAMMVIKILKQESWRGMLDSITAEFTDNFPRELDFYGEMAFMERARTALAFHSPEIYVPTLYREVSSVTMCVQEMIDGKTFNQIGLSGTAEEKAHCGKCLVTIIKSWANQIFRDGFFHADPHPGNLMVRKDGRPVVIDWGQCMELSRGQRRRLAQFTLLLATRSLSLIKVGLEAQGFKFSGDIDLNSMAALMFGLFDSETNGEFAEQIAKFAETAQRSPKDLNLFDELPREVVFFGRVMASFRRDCQILGIDVSAIEIFAPIARRELYNLCIEDSVPRSPGTPARVFEPDDEDSSQTFSPSRMLLVIPIGGDKWKKAEEMVRWGQDNYKLVHMFIDFLLKNQAEVTHAVKLTFDGRTVEQVPLFEIEQKLQWITKQADAASKVLEHSVKHSNLGGLDLQNISLDKIGPLIKVFGFVKSYPKLFVLFLLFQVFCTIYTVFGLSRQFL